MRHDTIFRNATLILGDGSVPYRGDLGLIGERISALGDLGSDRAGHEEDLGGLALAPGFIDAHTHDDGALLQPRGMEPKISQGVTTVIAGNCGVSLAPLVLSGMPPSPFTLVGGDGAFRFASFAEYVSAIDSAGIATNAALLVGHTTLRRSAMDDTSRAANPREIDVMRTAVGRALDEGAFGLSTGLDYPPAVGSSTEEVKALAAAAARLGGPYVTHIRNYFEHMDEAIEEAIEIARHAGTKLFLSHHQCTGRMNFGKAAASLARIDEARRELDIAVDAYPYAASSTELRRERCDTGIRILITWSEPHPEMADRDLAAIARQWGCSEREAGARLMPAGAVYFQLDENDVRTILGHPRTMIGSDGLPQDAHPHPRLWGACARVLGHYVRDVGLFSLEEAVHRMTGLPAKEFGIRDRGVLAEGAYADLVIFDPQEIADTATFEAPARQAAGIHRVLVNGQTVWNDRAATGARPGAVLRLGDDIGVKACDHPGR